MSAQGDKNSGIGFGGRRLSALIVAAATMSVLLLTGCDPTTTASGGAATIGCDPHGFGPLSGCDSGPNTSSGFTPDPGVTAHDIADAAKHEAAHKAVGDALGLPLRSCVINSDGSGRTDLWGEPDNPTDYIAYEAAGQVAVPATSDRADADNSKITEILDGIPAKDRVRVRHAGFAEAARIIAQRSRQIAGDAAQLRATGSL